MLGRLPNDPYFETIPPALKLWAYEQWVRDQEEKAEFTRRAQLFLASFINPKAVQQIENSTKFTSSEEDFEKSLEMMKKQPGVNLSDPVERRKQRRWKLKHRSALKSESSLPPSSLSIPKDY